MARKGTKQQDFLAIKTWEEADGALKRLGQLERERSGKELDLNKEIEELRAKYAEVSRPLEEERKRLERDLKEFAEDRRKEFGDSKSRALHFGVLSFRESSRVVIHSSEGTIAAIRQLMPDQEGMLLKIDIKLNKDVLTRLGDQELRALGCVRKTKDEFGYDINWEALPV